MSGSITQEDRDFVETWEHISPQQWGIIRFDARGDERPEVISGRQTFKITSEERIVTQDRIRQSVNDPFLNGSFRPVVVPDSVTVESNPNALSDEEIVRILTASDVAWEQWMDTIDSVATVRRMIDLADDNDDVSTKRYRELERKLEAVRGRVQISTNDPALKSFLSDRPSLQENNATASGGANPRRRGGLSSDYR